MADTSTRDAAIRRELGVPPTFDLVGHVRNLARILFPALVIALAVGGLVYAVRGSATPVYQSDIVAEVQSASQVVVTDANLGQLVAPYVALATDSDVVANIRSQLNNGWTAEDVSSHISVTPGTSPSLVFVKATAFSQDDADTLARTVVVTLSDAQARRNAEALDRRTRVLTDDIARLNGDLDAARQRSLDEDETRTIASAEVGGFRFRPAAIAFRPVGDGSSGCAETARRIGGCVLGCPYSRSRNPLCLPGPIQLASHRRMGTSNCQEVRGLASAATLASR